MIPILVLAAGASSRMQGSDKLLEEIDGQPLLRRSLERAMATGAEVFVTLPPAPHPRREVLNDLSIKVVDVPDAKEGISASLRRGVAELSPDAQHAMILLADLPDLDSGMLDTMIAAVTENPNHLAWRGTTSDGQSGHPVILARSLLDQVGRLKGDAGFAPLLKGLTKALCPVALPGNAACTDLDTPEAWRAWRANSARHG